MQESPLELVERLITEGKTTDQIRRALSGQEPPPPTLAKPMSPVTASPPASPPPAPVVVQPPPPLSTPPPLLAPSRAGRSLALPVIGWLFLALLCLEPAIILIFDQPATRFGNLSQSLLTIGDITGLIGLAAYVCTLILATRLRWFEDFFGGLNRVFLAHQILGQLSLLTILIHPFFTAFSYYQYGMRTVAHFFVPQLAYIGSAFGIIALALMIALLVVTLFIKLGYRLWLQTHKYLGLVYLLIVLHVLYTPNHINTSTIRWYVYALLWVGTLAYLYRTLLPDIFVRRYLYTMVSVEPKGVGVVEVTLAPINKKISFRPGQFVFLSFDNDALSREWHPFSVASGGTDDKLRLDIKSLGAYTETLTRLLPYMVGMTVRVEGAYGRFSYHNFGNLNQIWVAGGIGVTPFLSMAQTLGAGPYNIDLYYSVKTESELIDLDTLIQHQSNHPSQVFRVFPFITDKYNSFLSADFMAKNSGDLAHHDFLLCGPPPMLHAIKQQLTKLGVPSRRIHSEEFSLE